MGVVIKNNGVALLGLLLILSSSSTLAARQPANNTPALAFPPEEEPTSLRCCSNVYVDPVYSSWVTTLSVGPIFASGGSQQALLVNPGVTRTYTANQTTNVLAEGDLFFGINRTLTRRLKGQLGLDLAVTSAASLSGNIWDFEDPRFNNYNYTYSLQHAHLTLKGKLLLEMKNAFSPWVSGGLGVGFNRSSEFTTTSTLYEAIVLPGSNFTQNTTASLTYTLGCGLQYALTKDWRIGVGYEFADWGSSALGKAPLQTEGSQGLSLSHFYTNGLLFNLTWLV